METIIFGSTGLKVSRQGFGGIPIQRITYDESTAILRRAYEGGILLYDTAHGYTTSQDRIGKALGAFRKELVFCTKAPVNSLEFIEDAINNSLKMLQTDYLDVFQFHNPPFVPEPGAEDGFYDLLLKLKKDGKVKHIGITQHKYTLAKKAIESKNYEVLQYPFSYLSSDKELKLLELCVEQNMGVLAMKGMAGGLLTNAKAAFAFLRQYKNLVPIWGIEKMSELEEFLSFEESLPSISDAQKDIERDQAELSGSFCRGCGYCLPCPANIPIPMAARITFLLKRSVRESFITQEWQENMRRVDDCVNCGHCSQHCPYELDTPTLLKKEQKEYFSMI